MSVTLMPVTKATGERWKKQWPNGDAFGCSRCGRRPWKERSPVGEHSTIRGVLTKIKLVSEDLIPSHARLCRRCLGLYRFMTGQP